MTIAYKKVLLVGGCGFIGRNLLNRLLEMKVSVRCLDCKKMPWLGEEVDFIEGDFTAPHVIDRALEGMDAVVHLASTVLPQSSNDDPEYDISTNLVGTVRLIQSAVKQKVRKIVFLSSGGTIYGIPEKMPVSESHANRPLCSYGIVKLAAEKYLALAARQHGINTCSVRLANPYGPFQRGDIHQGAIAVFCHRALHNIPIEIWGDGAVRRDFIYIDDVVNALVKIIHAECRIGEINIGSGCAVSIKEIIACIKAKLNRELDIVYKPARDFDVPEICLDIARARSLLDWTPETDLTAGIEKTLHWQLNLDAGRK